MNIKLYIKSSLLVAFLIILSVNINAQSLDQSLNNATKLIELEKFESSRNILSTLTSTKKSDEAYFYTGISYLSNLNFEDPNISIKDAKESFTKGINSNNKSALNYVGLGIISLEDNDKNQAENYFKQALKLNNSYLTNLYIGKAYTYTNNKELEKAIGYLKNAIKRNRKSTDAYITLGDAYLKNNDPNNSILAYKTAQDINPAYFPTYIKQSAIYKYARNYNAALKPLNYIITTDSNYLPAYRHLAELYAASNQTDKALDIYKNQYMPRTDNSCSDNIVYAKFLFQASKYKESANLLKQLKEKCNLKPVFYRLLAYASYNTQDYKTANDAINTFFKEQDPNQFLASDYIYKSNISMSMGDAKEAKTYADKALETSNNSPEVISNLAQESFNLKHYDEAFNLYKKLDSTKLNAQELYYIGLSAYITKNYKEAESALNKLVEKKPNYVTAWAYLGYIKSSKETQKFTGAAKPFFEKVIELAAPDPQKHKDDLINAYQYMGQYELEINKSPKGVRRYMNKILEIDPNNQQAGKALKALNKASSKTNQNNSQ